MRPRRFIWLAVIFIIIIISYALTSYYVRQNSTVLRSLFAMDVVLGIFIFLILAVLDVVSVPIVLIPFVPIISDLYGSFFAGFLIFAGWTLGAIIAFFISRFYGKAVVGRLISKESINELRGLVPRKHVFWFIALTRLLLPMDVGSYGFGVFSEIKFEVYIAASMLGIIPASFFLTYLKNLPIYDEVLLLAAALVAIFIAWYAYSVGIRRARENLEREPLRRQV